MNKVRKELSWHGGHTLVVFQTLGETQITIDVLSSEKTNDPPPWRDSVTGRRVTHSLGLTEEGIAVLESFLRERREELGR